MESERARAPEQERHREGERECQSTETNRIKVQNADRPMTFGDEVGRGPGFQSSGFSGAPSTRAQAAQGLKVFV